MLRRLTALTALMLLVATAARATEDPKPQSTPLRDAVIRATDIQKRPAALTALYGSFGAMQALDIISTQRAIAAGAREQNPLMRGGSMGTMILTKAASGAATVFFAERMWKQNRVGAVLVMAALNGASAAIVARNLRNARH